MSEDERRGAADRQTRELIDALATDLTPVRPIPRLRSVAAGVVALWLVVAVAGLAAAGARPHDVEALLSGWGVAAIFASLIVTGLGGLVASLALGVPGREAAVRRGLVVAACGMAVAAGLGTVLFLGSPMPEMAASWTGDLGCLATALAVALLPALGVVAFAGRAAPDRPLVLVLAAAAGMAALGAATAQASCPYADYRHLLMGHVLAPVAGALLLAIPLLLALRRFGR